MAAAVQLRNSDIRRATALIALSGDNLVVERGTQIHSKVRPSIEVVCSSDSATGASALADGPVLVEGGRAGHRGLINLLVLVDVVDGTVAGDSSLVGHCATGVVVAVVLEDVVLDQGTGGPTVDREVRVSGGAECSFECDVPIGDTELAWLPWPCMLSFSYRALPVDHPLPEVKSPQSSQVTEYSPALPLVYSTVPPPLVQNE